MEKRQHLLKAKLNASLTFKFTFTLSILCMSTLYLFAPSERYPRDLTNIPVAIEDREEIADIVSPYTAHKIVSRHLGVNDLQTIHDIDVQELALIKSFTEDYLDFHERLRYKGTRRFVFRPRLRGMGDMFGTLVFAYWTAVVSKRVFLVDWREPFPLEDLIQTVRNSTDLFYRDSIDALPKFWDSVHFLNGTEESHPHFINVLLSNITTVFYAPHYRPSREIVYSFVKQSGVHSLNISNVLKLPSSVNFQRALMHHVFRLSDDIQRDHRYYANRLRLSRGYVPTEVSSLRRLYPYYARPYIAVHARIGSGVGEVNGRFKDVQKDMIVPARCLAYRALRMSFMAGYHPLPIFLATDTTEFRTIFQNVVASISHGRIAVVTGDWDVVHSGRFNDVPQNVSQDEKKKTESWKKVWGSYMDLAILGHAEHILSLYSEFPRFALALGDAKTLTELRNHLCLQNE